MSTTNENLLWEKINDSKAKPLTPKWLEETYSPSLSFELRIAITEQLGLLSEKGWLILKGLIKKHGIKKELIYGAGLCHQAEAREWLLTLLEKEKTIKLEILQALSCWGGFIPKDILKKILNEPSQAIRLAGIELLKFKANQLSDNELLEISKNLINDFREPVVLGILQILQRRDGCEITTSIAKLASNGSSQTSHAALLALGSIGTVTSKASLEILCQTLPHGPRREMAKKQFANGYYLSKEPGKSIL